MVDPLSKQQFVARNRRLIFGILAPGPLVLAAVFIYAPPTSALSLSLDTAVRLPLLAPVSASADIKLLDKQSGSLAGVSGSAAIGGNPITIPPVDVPAPTTPSPSTPASPPTTNEPLPSSPSGSTVETSRPAIPNSPEPEPATADTAESKASPSRSTPLELTLPGNFSLMPRTFSGYDGTFRTALIVLSTMAVIFMGVAVLTTSRLARGSPQKL